jgi:hypothetical protein
MSNIPVDLERRFEQRWAARFSSPIASTTPQKYQQLDPRKKDKKNPPSRVGRFETLGELQTSA